MSGTSTIQFTSRLRNIVPPSVQTSAESRPGSRIEELDDAAQPRHRLGLEVAAELRAGSSIAAGDARGSATPSASRRCSRRPTLSTGSRTCRAGRRAPGPAARPARSCRCGRRRPTGRARRGPRARGDRTTSTGGAAAPTASAAPGSGCRKAYSSSRTRSTSSGASAVRHDLMRASVAAAATRSLVPCPSVNQPKTGASTARAFVAPAGAGEQPRQARWRRAARTTSPAARRRGRSPGAGSPRRRRGRPPQRSSSPRTRCSSAR